MEKASMKSNTIRRRRRRVIICLLKYSRSLACALFLSMAVSASGHSKWTHMKSCAKMLQCNDDDDATAAT